MANNTFKAFMESQKEVNKSLDMRVTRIEEHLGLKPNSNEKNAPEEKVEFVKRNGEVKMVTKAQAKAWEARRENFEKAKATPAPEVIPAEVRAYVKAHPSCSAKEVKSLFPSAKGLRRDQLGELKVELGVR